MEKEILVVIGHRLGKGQNVAKGVEAAGGKAIVIPGMAADMKLGDVMKENNATFGISFCGVEELELLWLKLNMDIKQLHI